MKRVFIFLTTLLLCCATFAQGPEYTPVWAESGNLDFITVGNTNHKLVTPTQQGAFPGTRDDEIKNGKLAVIKSGDDLFSGNVNNVNNVNYKTFRISKPKAATCDGKLTIKKAFLSWGGRTSKSGKDKISFLITQEGKGVLGQANVTGTLVEKKLYEYEKHLYTCHADVTDDVNRILGNTFSQDAIFRIYVANVMTELDESHAPNGVQIGNYSGWTFTVIYEYSGLPERSIFYYQPDKVSDVVTTDAPRPAVPTLFNLKLDLPGGTKGLDLSRGTSVAIASLGGTNRIEDDKLVCNQTGTEKLKELDDLGGSKTTIIKHGDGNSFNGTVEYEYLFADGNNITSNSNHYTRGYDLHAFALSGEDVEKKIITKDRSSFNIAITNSDDPHHTSDILLMFGEPNMPEVVLKDNSPKNVTPGQELKYSLEVALNNNTEIFRDFELSIPLSEYVDSLVDVSITFPAKELGNNRNEWNPHPYPKSNNVLFLNTGSGDNAIPGQTDRWKYWSTVKKSTFLSNLNRMLREADARNYDRFLSNPTSIQQRVLKLKLDSIDNVYNVKSDQAIVITLTIKVKPEDDWAFDKNSLKGGATSYVPQSELTFTTPTDRASVVESMDKDDPFNWIDFICNQRNRGNGIGSGGGGGGGLGGGGGAGCGEKSTYSDKTASSKGLYVKDPKHVVVDVVASSNCPKVSKVDSLVFSYCGSSLDVTTGDIGAWLSSKYNFDVREIRKRDSLTWIDVKQDSIYMLARRHGVNRSQVEGLIDFSNLSAKAKTIDTLSKLAKCAGAGDLTLFDDSLNTILNSPMDLSNVYLLFEDKNLSTTFDTPNKISVLDDHTYTFNQKGEYYLQVYSPWNKGKCSDTVRLIVQDFSPVVPKVYYAGNEISQDTILYVCKESEIENIKIEKSNRIYDIYRTIGGEISKSDSAINRSSDKIFNWNLNEEVDTHNSGDYKISLWQAGGECKSAPFNFTVNVTPVAIKDHPNMTIKDTIVCSVPDGSKTLELSVKQDYDRNSFVPVWYREHSIDSSRVMLDSVVTSINVPLDSVDLFYYSVAFKSGQCISDLRDTTIVQVLPLPDTLASDTIYVCAGYEIKESDITSWLDIKRVDATYDTIKYYKKITDAEDEFVPLADLLATFSTDCSNSSVDFVENPFYVRVKNSCYSAPSRMVVRARCYNTDAPKFAEDIDSVLYCLGDQVASDLNAFIDPSEKSTYSKGYRWQWIPTAGSPVLPEFDNHTDFYSAVAATYGSRLDGKDQDREEFSVVRIDSNNCVSKADTFKVIVDENITTFPFVGDTLKTIVKNTDPVTLKTCQGVPFFKSSDIPTKPTVPDYTIEWFDKSEEVVTDSVFYDKIYGQPDVVGMSQYKVRQSTKLGCKGGWLDVNLVVNPKVTDEPEFDRIVLCSGDRKVDVVNKNTPSESNLTLNYYYFKDTAKVSPLSSISIQSDSIGEFINSHSLYTAAYRNVRTGCQGPLVNVEAVVSDLPHLPMLDKDTASLCLGSEQYNLVEVFGAAANALDNNIKLIWSAPTGVEVTEEGKATIKSSKKELKYYVKQKNELTTCVGKDTTVVVNIDKTFSFKRQKDTVRCYGESFDLLGAIVDSLRIKNDIINADVSFKVYKLTLNTPSSTPMTDAELSVIKSDAGRHEDQEKRFLVRYDDAVGGCSETDTVTLVFKGLPTIQPLSDIDTCYALPFNLPTLDNEYNYQWYRNDLTTKITERKVALEESEKLYLIAENRFECKDTSSINVTIHKNPIESLVKDTVFCQNTGAKTLEMKTQASDENDASKLITTLYDAAGNEIPRSINTDTVVVNGNRKVFDYYVVQKNLVTNCTSKTDFHVEVRKAFKLDAEDTRAICEPDSVDFAKHVMLYLSNNESSIGIIDLAKLDVKYARIDGNRSVDVDNEAASVLKHISGRDTVNYTYTISDEENVCTASDTVAVTIHFKPTAPKIVDSQDTAFLCGGNETLALSAVDTNSDKTNTAVFWGEYRNGVQGNDYTVLASASNVAYTAFTKNLKSGCVSDYDTTFAVVSAPVTVDVIGDSDSKRCAGEKINVYDILANSFHFDASIKRSFIKYEMTQNGVAASKSELSSVSRTVQDTILFEMTATDTLTGCSASNSMTVIFHNRPQNKIVAPIIACVGNSFEAQSVGEDRKAAYSWQTKEEVELSSISSLKINSLAHDTTLLLITNIEGTGCSDTLEHKVTVYATPDRLDAQQPFQFCQTDGDVKIEIARKAEDVAAYKLEWTSPVDSLVIDPLVVSAKKDTAYKLTVKQINITVDTVCKSDPIVVDVTVTKQISIALADTAICKPLDFNLAKYVQTKKSVSDDGFMPELTSVKFFDGTPVADSTSVETPGRYEIAYTDKYGCSVLASVNLAFINKPTTPVLDTDDAFNLCQGNDTVVKPVVVAGDYEFVWNNIGANRTFAAESLKIDASRPVENVAYTVVRRDTIYGCESDPQTLTYSVKAPFSFDELPVVDICEYETINLDSLAKAHLHPLDDLTLDIHRDGFGGDISSFNAERVAQEGTYVIDVKNTVSTCVASGSVKVNTHKKPAIKVSGNKPICEGNDLPLTAEGADYFYWNGLTAPSATYSVVSTDDNDITVSLLARSVVAENNKTCEMDSSFIVKVHTTPATLPSQDQFRFCQTNDDVNIELVRDAADAAAYSLEWMSKADSVVADKFVASARKDTAYELSVRQLNINSDTVCKSEPIKVKIEITKAIEIALADTAICMPLEFDLAQYAQTKKKVSEDGFLPQLSGVKLYEGGVEHSVGDSTKVTVAGNYRLVYTDKFNCPIVASTNLKFIKKPDTPILDVDPSFNLCVGVETTVNADIVAGSYKTSWTMVGNGAKSFGDALVLDVAKPISDGYDVVRIDTIYGCVSEKTHFDYNVIEPFRIAENRNLDICEYETIDLDSVSRAMYPDLDLKLEIVPTMTLDATMPFVASSASAEGVYLLNVEHQISNCKAQSEIKVNNYKKPEITVSGNTPICKGDTLLLKVDGGDFYYWNNSTVSVDSAFVPGLVDGVTNVNLSVSKLVGTSGKTCKTDSVVKVVVNPVPDLITSKLDVAYCQDGRTGALYLDPTDNEAKVVWYSPEDNYQTMRPNASFAPSASESGEFVFKFKQILGNCSTKLQNYLVTIEEKITDIPVVSDTSYCVNETPVELIAKWNDYSCDVKWTDKNMNDVDLLPSTVTSGQTQYCAHLTRGTCVGSLACMTVYVKDRFNTIADIQDTFRFCAKTGVHRLEPNTVIPGVRLNWYNIHDIKRADFAEFDTDANQGSDTYFVTQSEIDGCESDSVKVEVVKVPAVFEQTYVVDTCKGVSLTAAEIMLDNKVEYELKSLAKVAVDGTDSIIPLGGNIGFNGVYNLTVQSEYGCVGVEKIKVKMIEPELLTWPKDGFTSCPGDMIEINAGSSNSWFKLIENNTEIAYLYGVNESYKFVADEYKQFDIVAMVKGHESCISSKVLTYDVYTPEKPVVFGTPGVCKGDELKLSVGNIEKDFSWNYDGSLLSTTDEFRYVPEKSGYLRVSGSDKNGCFVSDTLAIKVIDILTPKILVHPRISSTQYHINRDTTEVDFEAKINTVDDGMFTYSWNFGDASIPGISQFENHVYSDTVVKLSRLVNVDLTVTHEFGCVGTAHTTLYIDPSIDVPNTFVVGTDVVFMENYDLEIFDRVGNLIHKGKGWDGTYDKNGDFVFHDTYFYSLTYYVGGEEQHKTGYITVVK